MACWSVADLEPSRFRFVDACCGFERRHSFNACRSPDEAGSDWRRLARAA